MDLDRMTACADMIIADAIEDLADEERIPIKEARDRLLNSKAYEALYDFDTRLWTEGSDYFLDYFRRQIA